MGFDDLKIDANIEVNLFKIRLVHQLNFNLCFLIVKSSVFLKGQILRGTFLYHSLAIALLVLTLWSR